MDKVSIAIIVSIVIIIIIIISSIIAIIVVLINQDSPSKSGCSVTSDCSPGSICIGGTGGGGGICKSGTGTVCTNNTDCAPGLICTDKDGTKTCQPGSTRKRLTTKRSSSDISISNQLPPPNQSLQQHHEPQHNHSISNQSINPMVKIGNGSRVRDTIGKFNPQILPSTIRILNNNNGVDRSVTPISDPVASDPKDPVAHQNNNPLKILGNIGSNVHNDITPLSDDRNVHFNNHIDRVNNNVTPLSDHNNSMRDVSPQIDHNNPMRDITPLSDRQQNNYITRSSDKHVMRKPRSYITGKKTIEIKSNDDDIETDDDHIDVRSPMTPRGNNEISVSTPCEEKGGVYYCKVDSIDDSSVIGVCSYSNAKVFLLGDGNIICETEDKRYRVNNNIKINKITSYEGYLYGLGYDSKLYTLPNNYFSNSNWIWNEVDWAPKGIKYISSTHDGSYIWIQTNQMGYLYGPDHKIKHQTEYNNSRRIYGRDESNYIDIDDSKRKAIVYPGGKVLNDVIDAALSYYGEVISITSKDSSKYRGITIVNWKPYYIK